MPPKNTAPKTVRIRFPKTVNVPYHLIIPGKTFSAKEVQAFGEIPDRRFGAGEIINMTGADIKKYGLRHKIDYVLVAEEPKPEKPKAPPAPTTPSTPVLPNTNNRGINTPPAR